MASLNKVILIGNIGKDPEIRRSESGAKIAKFSIATHETYKNKDGVREEQTEWHNIVILRDKLAEIAEKYIQKGGQVYIEGRIRTRTWNDREGNKKSITEIIADNFIILGKRKADNASDNDIIDIDNSHEAPSISDDNLNEGALPF